MLTVKGKTISKYKAMPDMTVLQTLEAAKVHHVSHCREGYCGVCRCKARGKVKYTTTPIAYIRQGEILPCIAIQQGDLEIEVRS